MLVLEALEGGDVPRLKVEIESLGFGLAGGGRFASDMFCTGLLRSCRFPGFWDRRGVNTKMTSHGVDLRIFLRVLRG